MQQEPRTYEYLFLFLCSLARLGFELYILWVLLTGDSFCEMSYTVSRQQAVQCPFPLRTHDAKSDHAHTTKSAMQHQLFCSSAPDIARLPWQSKHVLYVMCWGAVKCEGMKGREKGFICWSRKSWGGKRKGWWLLGTL